MRRFFPVAAVAASAAFSSGARAQAFSLEHYARVARLSDVRVAPAGDRAVIVVSWPNFDSNANESELVLVDLRTRAQQTLTHRRSVATPRWSPDGTRLAFTSTVDGKVQLFVLPMGGGEAVQVTRHPTGIGNYAWKGDGTAFVFAATASSPTRGKFDDSFEVDGNDYLTLSAPQRVQLWTVRAIGGEASSIARGEWSIPSLFSTLSWSGDGRSVVFTRQDGPGTRNWENRALAAADVATGVVSAIPGIERNLCGAAYPSPDATLLLLSCPVDGHVKNQQELLIVPVAGGAPRRLTASIDRNFGRGVWRRDGRAVVAWAPDGTRSAMWEIPLAGLPRRIDVGKIGVNDADVSSDGSIVFIGSEAQRPPELYVISPEGGPPQRITDFHAEVAAMTLGAVESFAWRSDDGLPLDGVVTLPPNFDASRKWPLVLNIHGGPWGSSRETFSTRNQLLAGKGFIVFEPNYRGSDNHGNALWSAVYRDHGAGPGRDIMAGLAILKKRAYVDTTRIGVSGWSYGGYMTTWLIGHYDGWKAALAGAAVIDLDDDYNLNDLSLYIRAYGPTLSFPKDLALLAEQSPRSYVDAMKTPLLLLSNTGDVRVPVTQSYKLYNALKERGRDVRMRLWPVPGHFPADPWRARDVDRAWAEWFVERLR